jgi:hypothetical protein
VRIFLLLGAVWIAAAATAAAESPPAYLARSSLRSANQTHSRGIVFFLRIPQAGAGAAAIGSASVFEPSELSGAQRVSFHALPSYKLVATSQALLVPPGWPVSAGATARSPHLVYALDARPEAVLVLDATGGETPPVGTRVRVVGLAGERPEERYGSIRQVTPDRFEVELDRPAAAHGWAGAPVLLAAQNRVIGTLESGIPEQASQRLGAVPISLLVRELAHPLDKGAGRRFARFTAPALPTAPPSGKLIEASAKETRVQLEVSLPADASLVPPETCGIFVSGRARALAGGRRSFDVALVIDTSLSTIEPTGSDVNRNGVIGQPNLGTVSSLFKTDREDPGDSILAAELAAARGLLWELDSRNTRVTLITFSGQLGRTATGFGSSEDVPPAVTREPLTRDFERIERSLDDLLETKPSGVTHMAAGVDQAIRELQGLGKARSKPDPRSEKVIFFLTDGQPTLPYGPGKDAANVGAVLEAAGRAKAAGIRVHTFAIGPEALAGPVATVELAARTQGYFIPVREPGDLVDVVEAVHFPDVHDVVVRNATTGARAHPFHADEDGNFAGLVQAKPGKNQIEIIARADDGASVRREIDVDIDPKAPPSAIPAELVTRRTALLEICLAEVKDKRREAEREQAERVRRELIVEIEREREQARIRAAEQRKELRIEVEDPQAKP